MFKNIVITSGVRTAIGDFGGALAATPTCELATLVAREAIGRASVSPSSVDQAVFGNVIHSEPRDMYLARVAAIDAGLPNSSSALTLNRLCGSGLQAVVTAAEAIMLGNAEIVVAGGAENMSRVGHLMTTARFGAKMGDVKATDMMLGALTDPFGNGHMGVTAENIAAQESIDRDNQDALALTSHHRAAAAIKAGYFKEQILPVAIKKARKEVLFDTDEHVRVDISPDDLRNLRPAFQKTGTVTAGNASGINDGAAALILSSERAASAHNMPRLAFVRSAAVAGVGPEVMGLGPIPAVKKALDRAGLAISDLSAIESNEAFAAQACAVASKLDFPPEITNPNGGAIALGHPVGASGAIILIKLIYELRRTGGRFGLATMCIGGGQGIAVIVENAEAVQ
ncbi:beta-ketothiolase BktB [Pelagibius sp. Alg239-R121]|uniref:beta-ketothiolase BktB n=1 Tax=Pelagibius sp. Alg239-R121 TaxID=2993448 RepID=UPI0024A77A5C|nr:beta-ketothiolase BktB [Pelagibius sp. Alg239-R121]